LIRKEVAGDCFPADNALYFIEENAWGGKADYLTIKTRVRGFDSIHSGDLMGRGFL
jgi:hypothetical protein